MSPSIGRKRICGIPLVLITGANKLFSISFTFILHCCARNVVHGDQSHRIASDGFLAEPMWLQSGTTLTRSDTRTSITLRDLCGRCIVNTVLWDGYSVTEILLIVEWNLGLGQADRKAIVDHCIEVAPGKLVFRKTLDRNNGMKAKYWTVDWSHPNIEVVSWQYSMYQQVINGLTDEQIAVCYLTRNR